MTNEYANFTDDHVPAPATHAPRATAHEASGTRTQARRLVIAGAGGMDHAYAQGLWIAMADADAVPIRR